MCTSVIVGEKATADGSFLVARSADSNALKAQHFVIHPAQDYPEGAMYRTQAHHGATAFEYPMPAHAMRFTTAPNWQTQLHGAVGFNEAGVGITGTESIFARDDALAVDPYNKESGITEDDILDVLLPRCRTAKEACALLGRIIEEQGAGEGFGVGFVDATDVWYLETGTGHQWIAHRTPADKYMATGNQGRLREYDPAREDMMGSPTVMDFAKANGFWNPETDGAFDFAKAYTRNDSRDRVYNDPRVWVMQKMLNPSIEQPVDDGRNFDVYLTPEKPITVNDLKAIMRNHFDGSEHDPYQFGLNGDEPWRPVSVFRTYESHVMQVRPWLPMAIGCTIYLAWGMADLSCYVPFYQGLERVPEHYGVGTAHADRRSVYWKFRKLQTLVMTDYAGLAPMVKKAFADFEALTAPRQAAMEDEYVELLKTDAAQAQALLNDFNLRILAEAEELAERLLDDCFTKRTTDIQEQIYFRNRKNKD